MLCQLLVNEPTVLPHFRALGDPTRVRILELQANEELAAGELGRRLGQPQPKVSNHLACLRWCGFVATRREHRVIYYRLADQRVAAILDLAQGLLDDNCDHVAASHQPEHGHLHPRFAAHSPATAAGGGAGLSWLPQPRCRDLPCRTSLRRGCRQR